MECLMENERVAYMTIVYNLYEENKKCPNCIECSLPLFNISCNEFCRYTAYYIIAKPLVLCLIVFIILVLIFSVSINLSC